MISNNNQSLSDDNQKKALAVAEYSLKLVEEIIKLNQEIKKNYSKFTSSKQVNNRMDDLKNLLAISHEKYADALVDSATSETDKVLKQRYYLDAIDHYKQVKSDHGLSDHVLMMINLSILSCYDELIEFCGDLPINNNNNNNNNNNHNAIDNNAKAHYARLLLNHIKKNLKNVAMPPFNLFDVYCSAFIATQILNEHDENLVYYAEKMRETYDNIPDSEKLTNSKYEHDYLLAVSYLDTVAASLALENDVELNKMVEMPKMPESKMNDFDQSTEEEIIHSDPLSKRILSVPNISNTNIPNNFDLDTEDESAQEISQSNKKQKLTHRNTFFQPNKPLPDFIFADEDFSQLVDKEFGPYDQLNLIQIKALIAREKSNEKKGINFDKPNLLRPLNILLRRKEQEAVKALEEQDWRKKGSEKISNSEKQGINTFISPAELLLSFLGLSEESKCKDESFLNKYNAKLDDIIEKRKELTHLYRNKLSFLTSFPQQFSIIPTKNYEKEIQSTADLFHATEKSAEKFNQYATLYNELKNKISPSIQYEKLKNEIAEDKDLQVTTQDQNLENILIEGLENVVKNFKEAYITCMKLSKIDTNYSNEHMNNALLCAKQMEWSILVMFDKVTSMYNINYRKDIAMHDFPKNEVVPKYTRRDEKTIKKCQKRAKIESEKKAKNDPHNQYAASFFSSFKPCSNEFNKEEIKELEKSNTMTDSFINLCQEKIASLDSQLKKLEEEKEQVLKKPNKEVKYLSRFDTKLMNKLDGKIAQCKMDINKINEEITQFALKTKLTTITNGAELNSAINAHLIYTYLDQKRVEEYVSHMLSIIHHLNQNKAPAYRPK